MNKRVDGLIISRVLFDMEYNICCEILRQVCSKISEKFGKHGLVKEKPTVRSLLAPLRMYDGMDEEEAPKKKPEPVDGPLLTECDEMKLERRKREEDRQREVRENIIFFL